MPAALLIAAALAAGPVTLDGRASVTLAGPAVRAGDVVRGLPARLAATEIARLPADRTEVTLSRTALAALVRRAMPGLTLAGAGPATVTFRRLAQARGTATCFVANAAIGAGEAIDPGRLRPAPCAGVPAAVVRYDRRSAAIVALERIAAGEPVGTVLPGPAPEIARGTALTLISRSGPVTVERPVTALQPGRTGRRMFVRSGDGQVFAIRAEGDRS